MILTYQLILRDRDRECVCVWGGGGGERTRTRKLEKERERMNDWINFILQTDRQTDPDPDTERGERDREIRRVEQHAAKKIHIIIFLGPQAEWKPFPLAECIARCSAKPTPLAWLWAFSVPDACDHWTAAGQGWSICNDSLCHRHCGSMAAWPKLSAESHALISLTGTVTSSQEPRTQTANPDLTLRASLSGTLSIAFRHLPPNSARFGYAAR